MLSILLRLTSPRAWRRRTKTPKANRRVWPPREVRRAYIGGRGGPGAVWGGRTTPSQSVADRGTGRTVSFGVSSRPVSSHLWFSLSIFPLLKKWSVLLFVNIVFIVRFFYFYFYIYWYFIFFRFTLEGFCTIT